MGLLGSTTGTVALVVVLVSLLQVVTASWIAAAPTSTTTPRRRSCQQPPPPRRQRQQRIREATTTTTQLPGTTPPRRPRAFGTGPSVDDEDYDSVRDEIEALGGDPFFLDSSDDDPNGDEPEKDTDPDFEWDGTVDDEAHLD